MANLQEKVFLEILKQLNVAQADAVNTIEGPVLTIAGPGTGKTHILSARIGKILTETDAQASNILCLTFTDAGVHAMRNRLLEFIGTDAHKVHIYTFHSFCNNIIQNNLELFGKHELSPLTDLERIEIIRQLMDGIPDDNAIKKDRANIYYYEKHLANLFNAIKSEDWSIPQIKSAIQAYLKDLPHREEYIYKRATAPHKKGDVKIAQLQAQEDKMKLLEAAVDLFPAYRKALAKAGRYDFADMIIWVLNAFRDNEMLLRRYQEQYLYFLVDEYQDTNGAQNELLKKLYAFWDAPNIFIVGDDDQSIYEFQGARLQNLEEFYTLFESEIKVVVLNENYRSSPQILSLSEQLISHNEKRIINRLDGLQLTKHLKAANPKYKKLQQQPKITAYPDPKHEMAGVLQSILKLKEAGVSLSQIAVIYARHKQVEGLIMLLEQKGIPYTTKRKVNILDLPFIRNILLLLEYIQLEQQKSYSGEHLLYWIWHFPYWGIEEVDIVAFTHQMTLSGQAYKQPYRSMMEAGKLKQFKLKNAERFLRFNQLIEGWIRDVTTRPLPIIIERLINQSGLLEYVLKQPDQWWLLEVLNTFVDFARKEQERNPRLNLYRFFQTLKAMDQNRLGIPLEKTIRSEEGIQFVTAHSAKGLEFEHVFIYDVSKENWEKEGRGRYNFTLPDTLTLSGMEDVLEAKRRLFYVAITRSRAGLYISYAKTKKQKDQQPAIFIDELKAEDKYIDFEEVMMDTQSLLEVNRLRLKSTDKPQIAPANKAAIKELLDGFQMSVSALNRYLTCPLSFYYESVLRVPSLMSEVGAYGVAVHEALQRLFETMLLSPTKTFPSLERFLEMYTKSMEKQEGYFSPKEYLRRLNVGQKYLTDYYQLAKDNWHKKVKIEQNISKVEVRGVPIKGTIDKIELYKDNKAVIVDYKTGKKSNKMRRPTKNNPLGGIYYRQLVFYKILYENAFPFAEKITSGRLLYLQPNRAGEFDEDVLEYTADDVAKVSNIIEETYAKIQAQEFYDGCGKDYCTWCNFVKKHAFPDKIINEGVEALDD